MKTLQPQVVDGVADLGSPHLYHLAADGTYLMTMVIVGITCLILRSALEPVTDDEP